MQFSNKDYNPDQHDRWRALTVKNPFATQLVTAAYEDNGVIYGEKTIEVRSKSTTYRGDLLICSSKNPDLPGYENGVTLGLVELYDVKPVAEFTPLDWEQTRIPPEKRKAQRGRRRDFIAVPVHRDDRAGPVKRDLNLGQPAAVQLEVAAERREHGPGVFDVGISVVCPR